MAEELKELAGDSGTFQTLETQILFATFSPEGDLLYRDLAWESVFLKDPNPWILLDAEDRQRVHDYLIDAGRGQLVTREVVFVTTMGRDEPVPVLLNFLPVRKAGDFLAVTVTGEVLAEPTTWTASQTQRHRLESLGRMTMGIAHDVNNLLSTVLGHAELMKVSLRQSAGAESVEEHVRLIEQAALDGASLVARIQQYIRLEKNARFEAIDVNNLIIDCISLTSPYWLNEPRRVGIDISIERELEDVPKISGSATELREVFVNLILNAVQAMPRGGKIRFSSSFEKDRGVIVRVSDNGIGMSEEIRNRIFEPLFSTKGEQGTGMGLAVAYGIIQTHEGTITVKSVPDVGTAFEIVLPETKITQQKESKKESLDQHKPVSILVVDDDPMVRNVLVRLLSLNKHRVDQAASGSEALQKMSVGSYDIVFTDQGMPEMSGRQLAAAIRSHLPGMPLVLLTGHTEAGEADGNIDAVLAKPFRLEQLQNVIEALVK